MKTGKVHKHSFDDKLNGRKLINISQPFWNPKKKDWYVFANVENILNGHFSSKMYPFKMIDIVFDI